MEIPASSPPTVRDGWGLCPGSNRCQKQEFKWSGRGRGVITACAASLHFMASSPSSTRTRLTPATYRWDSGIFSCCRTQFIHSCLHDKMQQPRARTVTFSAAYPSHRAALDVISSGAPSSRIARNLVAFGRSRGVRRGSWASSTLG